MTFARQSETLDYCQEIAKDLAIKEVKGSTMPRADMIASERTWFHSFASATAEVVNGFLFEEFWAEQDIPF